MAILVANINGTKVYSDKTMNSIVNTRVTFTDGSWCDIATGYVVNKGPGYINIGSPEESASEKVTKGPKTYSARNLEVRNVVADLEVQVHQAGNIEVTIVGPDNEVKAIRVNQQGDTVVIEGDKATVEGVTITSGNGRSITRVGRISISSGGSIVGRSIITRNRSIVSTGDISISGQNVVINGGGENQTKIIVKVPKGAAVNLSGVSGNTVVADTDGPLEVDTSSGDVKAGRVSNATLNVRGSCDIVVEEVNGLLTMSVMGSGDIRVRSGRVSILVINVMGSGDASFNGQAESANLTMMGSGDIHVAGVEKRPSQRVMGSGDIHVGNW